MLWSRSTRWRMLTWQTVLAMASSPATWRFSMKKYVWWRSTSRFPIKMMFWRAKPGKSRVTVVLFSQDMGDQREIQAFLVRLLQEMYYLVWPPLPCLGFVPHHREVCDQDQETQQYQIFLQDSWIWGEPGCMWTVWERRRAIWLSGLRGDAALGMPGQA